MQNLPTDIKLDLDGTRDYIEIEISYMILENNKV